MAKHILPHAPPDTEEIQYHPICLKFIDREQHQPEAFAHLCESIRKNGLRHPIVIHEGMILDGRNRHKACLKVGVEPRFKPLPDGEDPLEYAIEENITTDGQYTVGQRALIAARMVTTRQGRQQLKVSSETFVSVEKAATLLDISVSSVKRGLYILKYADDEMIASIESGDLAITKAETVIREAQVAAARQAEREAEREANPEEYARQAERREAAWAEISAKAAEQPNAAESINAIDKVLDEKEPAAEKSFNPFTRMMDGKKPAADESATHLPPQAMDTDVAPTFSSLESDDIESDIEAENWRIDFSLFKELNDAYRRMAIPGTAAAVVNAVGQALYVRFGNAQNGAAVRELFPAATSVSSIFPAAFDSLAQEHPDKLWRVPDAAQQAFDKAEEFYKKEWQEYVREHPIDSPADKETPSSTAPNLARISKEVTVKQEYDIPGGSTVPRGEFYTPPFWIERVRHAMGSIDFDPASSDIAQRNVEASAYLTAADDALSESTEWGGPNLYICPPSALEPTRKFALRLLAELKDGTFEQAIWLSHAVTYTTHGQELLKQARVVFFPRHRILFLNEEAHELPPGPVAPMLVGLGPRLDVERFKEAFDGHGTCLFPREQNHDFA